LVAAALIAETLRELDLQMRPLSPKVLPHRPSPLHPSALDSLPLHDEDQQAARSSPAKRQKVNKDGVSDGGLGARAREFVLAAALNAVTDTEVGEVESVQAEERGAALTEPR